MYTIIAVPVISVNCPMSTYGSRETHELVLSVYIYYYIYMYCNVNTNSMNKVSIIQPAINY